MRSYRVLVAHPLRPLCAYGVDIKIHELGKKHSPGILRRSHCAFEALTTRILHVSRLIDDFTAFLVWSDGGIRKSLVYLKVFFELRVNVLYLFTLCSNIRASSDSENKVCEVKGDFVHNVHLVKELF